MRCFVLFFILFISSFNSAASAEPIISPESYFGTALGEKHLRYGQIENYLTYLAQQSNNLTRAKYGQSHQGRALKLSIISSAENLANLDKLRIRHEQLNNPYASKLDTENMPVFIWLSFSSHGNEPSGSHAAIKLIHKLLTDQSPQVQQWLKHSIILLDTIANPDGFDNFAHWANKNYSQYPSDDRQNQANLEPWPSARGNHYHFDLNRDWLPLTQIESQARIEQYHKWKPNLLADFHEMQSDHSYFFQPGVPSRVNPLTPKENIQLTKALTDYTASSFDKQGKLYFSEERFDDFYIGKGSTYPDIQGGLGILLEQAGSLGQVIETQFGQLTFAKTIDNQFTGAISMLRAANAKRVELLNYQQNFFKQSIELAKQDDLSGFIVTAPAGDEQQKLYRFLNLLQQHKINAFKLTDDLSLNKVTYSKETSYWIPLAQAQYRLIKSLFSEQTQFEDHVFYDVTNWNLALAQGIQYQPIEKRLFGIKADSKPWQKNTHTIAEKNALNPAATAWIFNWQAPNAPALLTALLAKKVIVRVAEKPITAVTQTGNKTFSAGSLLVIRSENKQTDLEQLAQLANQYLVSYDNLLTTHTPNGPDLGSAFQVKLSLPNAAILIGDQVSAFEVGQIWHHFDTQLNLPLNQLSIARLKQINLEKYSHLIMPSGDYQTLPKSWVNKLTNWIKQGGTLITLKRASLWASQKGFISNEFLTQRDLELAFKESHYDYQDQEAYLAERMLTGSVFKLNLDTSHPLALGYEQKDLSIFKNDRVMLLQSGSPFHDVARYVNDPLVAGYASKANQKSLANTVALTAYKLGKGQIIAFADDPLYRGYWFASAPLFNNSIYFSHLINFTH
ncbi:M14 family zinc carboxypeptidase [Catenovulum adriaticum]|uniref:M14 family zinc carboxypeptidase n=1 Tax=Catenovulum adriaticum TaxID=2984846 RepID=A0ABY7AKD8_9ALTE|nr:M14 family zinc carboxypeptidase [Catenovulum sp. TS8]WAJ70012.1 M14 family zinc carboxypeptidase [Catenovulum sp. TS8]